MERLKTNKHTTTSRTNIPRELLVVSTFSRVRELHTTSLLSHP